MQTSNNKVTADRPTWRTVALLTASLLPTLCFAAGHRTHFLTRGPSPAASGRGETGTVSPDGPAALFYNPALIAGMTTGAALSHHLLFEGSTYSFAGVVLGAGASSFALSVIELASGPTEIRASLTDRPRTATATSRAYQLTYAGRRDAEPAFDYGVTLKYVSLDMYRHAAGGFGADLGIARSLRGPEIAGTVSTFLTGAAIQNAYQPVIRLYREEETFRPVYRAGTAWELPLFYSYHTHDTLRILADVVAQEGVVAVHAGGEYVFRQTCFLRGGVYGSHVTAGTGYSAGGIRIDYSIDLCGYTEFHRFGVSFPLGYGPDGKRHASSDGELTLKEEAARSLREARRTMKRRDREIRPLFNEARRHYRRREYLKAYDGFRKLMIDYPEYESVRIYYRRVVETMEKEGTDGSDPDFESLSYAKGFLLYTGHRIEEALNEWNKVLRMNPGRTELEEYVRSAREYIRDNARRERERDIEQRVRTLYGQGEKAFARRRWVSGIKRMESVQRICRKEPFPAALEWHARADKWIMKAIGELSRHGGAARKPAGVAAVTKDPVREPATEVDAEGAQRRYTEGLVLYAQGKIADAIRLWEIALRLDPSHEKASKAVRKASDELNAATRTRRRKAPSRLETGETEQ